MKWQDIPGVENAEDVVAIPGSDWVITSAMASEQVPRPRTFFINTRTREARLAWPDNCRIDLDRERFGEVEPPEAYSFHGLDVIQRGSVIEVYQVNHAPEHASPGSGRESVEVFEVDLNDDCPALRWRGAVHGPAWLNGNDLCALPGGGFAITNFCYPGPEAAQMGLRGGICGNVLEWKDRDEGWTIVPGSDLNYPNGIALAPDNESFFVASWGLNKVVRIPRTASKVARTEIAMPGLVDNITWTPDGALLCCVQVECMSDLFAKVESTGRLQCPFKAVKIDPLTLETSVLVGGDIQDFFATTVLQVGQREFWASSAFGKRLLSINL